MKAQKQACLEHCRDIRQGQKVGVKNKRRELKERTMKDSIKVVAKERAKMGVEFNQEAIINHPFMKRYLDGKEEKVGLRELITKIEAEI
jgi:superoxide dismutase